MTSFVALRRDASVLDAFKGALRWRRTEFVPAGTGVVSGEVKGGADWKSACVA